MSDIIAPFNIIMNHTRTFTLLSCQGLIKHVES